MNLMQITGSLLSRNAVLSFSGNLVPLLVGIVTIPIVISGLGTERFGILSLVGVVLFYFTLFDLGVGRATTRFVAQTLGESESQKLRALVWTALTLHVLLGMVAGAVLASVTPLLVDHVFNIPAGLVGEAREALFLLAASVPVVLILESLRGVLEAGQRFDLANAVKIPLASLTFLIPAAAVLMGFAIPVIILLLLAARLLASLVYLVLCLRVFPTLRQGFLFEGKLLYPLLSYGGWLTISGVGGLLLLLDRVFIASLLSMTAVTHYTVPYAIVTQLSIFQISLLAVLFPLFSTLAGSRELAKVEHMVVRSLKYLLLLIGPLVLILVFYANDLLTIWVGSEFADQSKLVLQILAVGLLVNSLAAVPSSVLQSVGRPDIPAKFYMLELIGYLGMLWLLIANAGIAGAALAWTLRFIIDGGLLFGACIRLKLLSFRGLSQHGLVRSISAVAVLAVVLGVSFPFVTAAPVRLVILAALLAAFAFVAWRYVADAAEKRALATVTRHYLGIVRPRYSTD